MRMAKSFTIEPDINTYVDTTKGDRSASERVNELLKRAIVQECYEKLEADANEFYSTETAEERAETKAFQSASIRSMARD
jgi:hypothetical protein